MTEVLRIPYDRPPEASEGLVIHCSSARFQPFFREFIEKSLGLRHFDRIAVPGGAQFLSLVTYLPKVLVGRRPVDQIPLRFEAALPHHPHRP